MDKTNKNLIDKIRPETTQFILNELDKMIENAWEKYHE